MITKSIKKILTLKVEVNFGQFGNFFHWIWYNQDFLSHKITVIICRVILVAGNLEIHKIIIKNNAETVSLTRI